MSSAREAAEKAVATTLEQFGVGEPQFWNALRSAIEREILAERAACAKIAGQHMCNHVAAAIRARE